MTIKPYKLKVPSRRTPRFRVNRLKRNLGVEENLTGWVNGKNASDIEERFAKALRAKRVDFKFRVDVRTAISIPGRDREIDFLIDLGGRWRAVEVDGEIGHKNMGQKSRDVVREIYINESLRKEGILPIARVHWRKLQNQEMAARAVLELL
jgi:hypothetical protein